MKKALSLLLGALLVLSAFTACSSGKNETHTHTFATDWSSDENNHWHVATCEHANEISDKAAHVDANNDDICDVCSYAKDHTHTYDTTVWKWDNESHYHASTCGHEVKQDVGVHVDENNDGVCDICTYNYDHVHTYANEWTFDKDNHWHAPSCGHTVANDATAPHADENNDGLCDVCGYDYDHTHTYAEAWEADEVYHWHKASCGHEVISEKLQHKDEDKDAYCDDCHKLVGEIVTYQATIMGNEFVTFISDTTVTGNAGSEVIFTFTAPVMVAIDGVENAELVGEPVEADGIKTYTVKIAALNADTTVTVMAHRISNATVIVPDGKVTFVTDGIGFFTEQIEVDIPSAGRYIIYSTNCADAGFSVEGNTLEQNSMAISYVFEVAKTGKITIDCSYFAWDAETVEVNYVIVKVETSNALNALEGSGYELPTNADITVTFKVPSAGLWQITSSTPVSFNGDETVPYIFVVVEGELERTIVLHYRTSESTTFAFDWKISKVGGEPTVAVEGENNVVAPVVDYTAITFTPAISGAYRFTMSSEAMYLYEWEADEYYSYMSGMGSDCIFDNLEAGKTYTFYVHVYEYTYEDVTEDLNGTLTITYMGYIPSMSDGADNTQSGSALVGVSNTFINDNDEAEYEITAFEGLISLDGGLTWQSSVSVTIAEGDMLTYMVKGTNDTATAVVVTFHQVIYEGELSIGGENTLTLLPGKKYHLTLSGSAGGYFGQYQIEWNNPDVILTYKNKSMTSPASIDMYTSYSSLVAVNNSDSAVTVHFSLTDTGTNVSGDDDTISLGDNLLNVPTGMEGKDFTFVASYAGSYTFTFDATGMYVIFVQGMNYEMATSPYTVTLAAGEELTINLSHDEAGSVSFSLEVSFAASGDQGGSDDDNGLHVGNNAIDVPRWSETTVTFTATEAGTYTFSFADGETNGVVGNNGDWGFVEYDMPYTVTLDAGESITLVVCTVDFNADTVDIVITKD